MTLQTPFHRLIFPLTRYIYRHADAVVAYGEHVQRYLVSQGVAQQKIFVAPHAVDNEKHGRAIDPIEIQSLRDKLEVSNDQRIVLYLGRLEPQKGLGDLLQAFRLLRSSGAVLVFAGEGSERSRLEKLTEELGLTGRVRFAGYVPSQETPCYFAMAYVLVLPSITTRSSKETWGLVINEAMNQGCPVIATDAVGAVAGGLVQHDKNGFVVPEGCVSEFAGALQRLFDDPAVRQRLGAAAHRRIASWDNEGMVLGFRRALDYVMNKKSGVEEQPDTLDAPDHIPVVK